MLDLQRLLAVKDGVILVSNLALEDFLSLIENIRKMAKSLLLKQSTFLPFGALISQSGELSFVAVEFSKEDLKSNGTKTACVEVLRKETRTGLYRSVGVCLDQVATGNGSSKKLNFVRIYLEQCDGSFDVIMIQYRKGVLSGLKFDEPYSEVEPESLSIFSP